MQAGSVQPVLAGRVPEMAVRASASQEQGSAQVQAALAELEWAQVLESQAEPESLESVPELDLLAGMDSQAGQVTQAARVAQALGSQGSQGRESARQEQQESQAGQACQPQSSAHTHAHSRHT